MSMNDSGLQQVKVKIEALLGKSAWQVSLGVGSFITFEFGAVIANEKIPQRPHGEWHLWITHCAWCLQEGETFVAGSEDPRSELQQAVKRLMNRELRTVELTPIWETKFVFSDDVVLHLLPVHSSEYEHWMLYTPDGNVLCVGPGSSWSYTSARQP